MSETEKFVPTVLHGFVGARLQQAWVGTLGTIEWRMVEQPKRPECTVGHIDMEAEDEPQS